MAAETSMGKWMWQNHTQWVASKAKKLADKYGADIEKAHCAALLHDLADCQYERGHEKFNSWTEAKGKEILLGAGFNKDEVQDVLEAIRTHSCRPGEVPTSQEGKVLATADGLWHLKTNFFPIMCYMHRPQNTGSYTEWQEWFLQKIDRDYNGKIFFEDEKSEAKEDYKALLKVFGNETLNQESTELKPPEM